MADDAHAAHDAAILQRLVLPRDVNLIGNAHGGVVLTLIDEAATIAAVRCAGGPVVTAAIAEVVFLKPVNVGDVLSGHASVVETGHTSIAVAIEVHAAHLADSASEQVVARAGATMVAVDDDGRPRPIGLAID